MFFGSNYVPSLRRRIFSGKLHSINNTLLLAMHILRVFKVTKSINSITRYLLLESFAKSFAVQRLDLFNRRMRKLELNLTCWIARVLETGEQGKHDPTNDARYIYIPPSGLVVIGTMKVQTARLMPA